jgi:hypothetical protein
METTGGLNISYDDGAHWFKGNSHGVSQFYAVNVDEQEPTIFMVVCKTMARL